MAKDISCLPEEDYKIALALVSHNRYEYLCRCLDTLRDSGASGIRLLIIDDKSTDRRVIERINAFEMDGVDIERKFLWFNRGHPNKVVKIAMKHFMKKYADYDLFGVIDNDVIFKKNWLPYLLVQYEEAKRRDLRISMLTSFNATGKCLDGGGAPIVETYEHKCGKFGLKQSVGGCHLLFPPAILKEFGFWNTRPSRGSWDRQWSRVSREKGYCCLVALPSYVQHIGGEGLNTGDGDYDRALDF